MFARCQLMKDCSTLYRLFQTYYSECFEPYGLGSGQHFFLVEIQHKPGITMTELAELGAYDGATVTRAVKRLNQSGYVIITPDQTDHRVKRLYLTDEGRKMVEIIAEKRRALFDVVTVGFTEDELAQTYELLERLAQNTRAAREAMRARRDDQAYTADDL